MLGLLHIENIAVIAAADIEFRRGFNILTGETGAGKSIIIDAICALMGERTSRDIIRTGEKSALVSGVFSGIGPEIAAKARSLGHEPEEGGVLQLSRQVYADGRNICRINGRLVSLAELKELGSALVRTHGQHDTKILLESSEHIGILDAYAGCGDLLEEYTALLASLKDIRNRQRKILTDTGEKERRLEMLRYQINEIEASAIKPDEDEELTKRKKKAQSAEKTVKNLNAALSLLNGQQDGSVAENLENAARALAEISNLCGKSIDDASKALYDMSYAVKDYAEAVGAELSEYDFSEKELDDIEERLSQLNMLKRKYGGSLESVLEYLEKAKKEVSDIEISDELMQRLTEEYDIQYKKTIAAAKKLSEKRKASAAELEKAVNAELRYLCMEGARFSVVFNEKRRDGRVIFGSDGIDIVEFYIAANKGEKPRPLAKCASGGELSRIMLAINTVSNRGEAETLIFDEVDAGISGIAASRVADRLANLAREKQVLCVSHLSQLAAMADTHFLIRKAQADGRTQTYVSELDFDGRVREIARINGGENYSQATMTAAAEQLKTAERLKTRM